MTNMIKLSILLIMTMSMMISIMAITESTTLAFASTESDEDDNQPNTKEEDEGFAKELCESNIYNGEWKDGECTNFPGGQSSASIGYGDECEDSDFQKEHPYFCKVKE